jgi:agmatinase
MGLNAPELPPEELHVGIVGVPYDGSVTHERGAAEAPQMLREVSHDRWPLTENLVDLKGLSLRDFGDVKVDNDDPAATQRAVAAAVSPIVEAGVIPLVLGGDHSITSAVVAAFRFKEELGIVWMDAHPDLMDTYKGLKGREESKWNHACPLRRILELPNISPEDLLLLGVRDFIPEELRFIRKQEIEVIYARELNRAMPEAVAERIRRKFADVPEVYISFDIDILDPAYAPGTGVPVPGGISTRSLYDLIYCLFDDLRSSGNLPRIAGFDLVEIAPPLDVGRITSFAGMGIIMGCWA